MAPLLDRYYEYSAAVLQAREGDLTIYRRVLDQSVHAGDRILHIGCGWDRSAIMWPYREKCEIVGVDVDAVAGRDYHSQFWHASASALPFADASFDMICSEYFFEHVLDLEPVMAEITRVLKVSGKMVGLTPNRWSYKSMVAAVTPNRVHELAAARLRPDAREAADVYPTHYRLNTSTAFHHTAAVHGMAIEQLLYVNNGPTWFQHIPGLFELGRVYHWLIDQHPRLGWLRCGIMVAMRRRDVGGLPADRPPRRRRDPMTIRCNECGRDGMKRGTVAYECPFCGHDYPIEGHIVHVL